MYITRTFTYTKAHISEMSVVEDKPVITAIGTMVLDGDCTKAQAKKAAVKEYPDKDIMVTSVEVVTELRGMTVENFIKGSVIMENPRKPLTAPQDEAPKPQDEAPKPQDEAPKPQDAPQDKAPKSGKK